MDTRKYSRFQVRIPISFTEVPTVGDRTVPNLSTGGCAVTSAQTAQRGANLTLRILLPDQEEPVKIDLAAVRWSGGGALGVEFLQMGNQAWDRIYRFVATVAHASV